MRQFLQSSLRLRSGLTFTAKRFIAVNKQNLTTPLSQVDPEMTEIINLEKKRQKESINLIASENFASKAVMEAVGSVMTNKYSEGYPGARYYGGNACIDMSENLCIKRALSAFHCDPAKWGVNVQPLSGSPCNFYVYTALLAPHDRLMALDLPHGGHLSHGYQTETRKVSAVSTYFECLPYRLNEKTGLIDYDKLEETASVYRPKLIIAGASSYSRHYDYKRMRKIADSVNAYLMSDMAHISGMVAADLIPSPFEYSDIVTTTTHKSLRGPRGAMIFYRQGERKTDAKGNKIMYDLKTRIDNAVFPGHQGGPHNHTISGLAVALKLASQPEFKEYQAQVLKNCKAMADKLQKLGYALVSGGTDNHLILLDLTPKKLDGARVETVLDWVNISVNKNTVPGDKSALVPSGLRLGSPAMTSRGMVEKDFEDIVDFLDRAVKITNTIKGKSGTKLADFKKYLQENAKGDAEIQKLKQDVIQFSSRFESPQ